MYVQSGVCGAFCGGLAGRKALAGCMPGVSGTAGFVKRRGVGECGSLGLFQRVMQSRSGRREDIEVSCCLYSVHDCVNDASHLHVICCVGPRQHKRCTYNNNN